MLGLGLRRTSLGLELPDDVAKPKKASFERVAVQLLEMTLVAT